MSGSTLYRLEALVEPTAWADLAVSRAVLSYPAVAIAAPTADSLRAMAQLEPHPPARVIRFLRAAAVGVAPDSPDHVLAPLEAIAEVLATRLFDEHLLGETFFGALRDEPTRYTDGPGTLVLGELCITPAALRALPSRPVLESVYEPAVTLFMLMHHGFLDVFSEIRCAAAHPSGR
jgi:hypothetical protein